MLQRRMLWRLPVVLRGGEKKFGEAKASGKIRKKGFGDTLRGLFPYGCAGSFCIGGFENFLLGIFFVKLINNIYY